MAKVLFIAVAFLFAVGCTWAENVKPLRAIAVINGPNGVYGNVTFSQNGCGESVLIEVYITGLAPGDHGFHIHEKGDLSNGCMSTGGHFNPEKLDHGGPKDQVRHVGDLGNLRANDNSVAETKFSDQVINLGGPRSIIGRAVVVHTGTDDYGKTSHPDSKKTGNAGGRAGCGVIGIVEFPDDWPCSSAGHLMISSVFSALVMFTVARHFI